MGMDIANGREDCMSGCRSLGSNCQRLSQSRKISVGVLPTPVINSQTKSVKETAIAENGTYGIGNCAKDHKESSSPLVRKEVTISPRDASPWVSTRPFNTKVSVSSVAVHSPNFTSTKHLRPKLSKKVSVAHSVKYFGERKFDMKSDEGKQVNHGEPANVKNVEHVENVSTEPEVLREKELGGDKQGKTETEGCGNLKMKLWEILGNVTSPSKQCPGSQSVELKQSQERDTKDSRIVKANQKSDTIESDSQRPDHTLKKPLLPSSTRKDASTREHSKEIEAKSSTLHRKESVQKDIFSFRGEPPGRFTDTANDGIVCHKRKNKTDKKAFGLEKLPGDMHINDKRQESEDKIRLVSSAEKLLTEKDKVHTANDSFVCYKRRNKSEKEISGPEKLQGNTFGIYDKKRRQSEDQPKSVPSSENLNTERDKGPIANIARDQRTNAFTGRGIGNKNKNKTKTKSVSSAEKSSIQRNKVRNAKSTTNRRNDDFSESKTAIKKTNACKVPVNRQTELKRDVLIPIVKDQQEGIANSLLKNRMDSLQDLTSPVKSPVNNFPVSAETKEGHLNNLSPADNVAGTHGIQSFMSLLNSKTSEHKLKAQVKNRMDSSQDLTSPVKSPVNNFAVLAETKKGHLDNLSPVDNVAATDGIQSFKSLLNSKTSECKLKSQDGGVEPKYCPSSKLDFAKDGGKRLAECKLNAQEGEGELKYWPSTKLDFTMEDDKGKRLSKSSSDTSDSEASGDETNMKETRKATLHDQRPVDNIVATDCVRNFKSFINLKPSECKLNVQDAGEELKDCALTMEEDRVNRFSDSDIDTTDSESSEDDANIKGGRQPEALSTQTYVTEKFIYGPNKRSRNERSVQVTECTPVSGSSREVEEINEHQRNLEQCQEDGLAGAVTLLAAALNRIKIKLKSVSSKRTAEILQASAEDICLQLQNAESQIKTDMGKLTSLSKLKRKRLETRFQEKQDQLLGIFKKFKEEVDQHLNYGSILEELEEHEVELKGSMEKHRENHMKLITQVEQVIKGQLDDAESRIVAIQDTAKEKMLQLKLVVAECAKTCSAWLG